MERDGGGKLVLVVLTVQAERVGGDNLNVEIVEIEAAFAGQGVKA